MGIFFHKYLKIEDHPMVGIWMNLFNGLDLDLGGSSKNKKNKKEDGHG